MKKTLVIILGLIVASSAFALVSKTQLLESLLNAAVTSKAANEARCASQSLQDQSRIDQLNAQIAALPSPSPSPSPSQAQ